MKDFRRPLTGNFMRWNGSTWVIKIQRKGVIHAEIPGTGETDKLRLVAWQQGCVDGTIVMVEDPAAELPEDRQDLTKIQFASLPSSMQTEVSRQRRYIQAFSDPIGFYDEFLPAVPPNQRHIPRSLSPKQVEPFFRDVAKTFETKDAPPDRPPGSTTFRGWYKKWTRYQDWNLMAPRYDRRGPSERKIIIGPMQTIADRAIDRIWMQPNKHTKLDVWEEINTKLDKWNDNHPDKLALQVSRRQIERYIDEATDQYDVAVARYGKAYADKKFLPVMRGPVPDYIFDLVEIDHTQAKVEVTDDETGRPLGRPWITAAIDKRSRMVVGLHVHFEGQSLNAVMQALRNTMAPKTYLRMLLPDLDYEYTCCGIPVSFFFDRGPDFDNEHVQEVGLNLDIIIKYAPGEHPEYKGSIERFFGTLHKKVALKLPGAMPRIAKGVKRPAKTEAKITFSDFYERLWRWIALVYSKDFHEGIDDIPLNRWRESEELRAPRPPHAKTKSDPFLMRVVRCEASRKGVQHKGLIWNGDVIKTILSHPSHRTRNPILVRIDDSDLGTAYVMDPVTRSLEPLKPVLDHYMPGTTWFQHDLVLRNLAKKKKGTHSERALMDAKAVLRDEAVDLLHKPATKSKTRSRIARMLGIGSLAPAGDELGSLHPDADIRHWRLPEADPASKGVAARPADPKAPLGTSEDKSTTAASAQPEERNVTGATKTAARSRSVKMPVELPDRE